MTVGKLIQLFSEVTSTYREFESKLELYHVLDWTQKVVN